MLLKGSMYQFSKRPYSKFLCEAYYNKELLHFVLYKELFKLKDSKRALKSFPCLPFFILWKT